MKPSICNVCGRQPDERTAPSGLLLCGGCGKYVCPFCWAVGREVCLPCDALGGK